MTNIKIAMLPLDICQASPAQNIESVRIYSENLEPDTDILALPELFSTGFIKDIDEAEQLAETIDGCTINALRQIAAKHNVAISGSFLCKDDDNSLRNRAFFIKPGADCDRSVIYYDKHHLFVLSDEKRIFKEGECLPPVIDFRGWKVAITICYDLRFPVWMRNVGNRYDLMIVPANWPDSRGYAWQSLLVARAIENQAVYVGVNRSGTDDFGTYSADLTMGYDELGAPKTSVTTGLIRYASFSLDGINTLRHRFPVHLNADTFSLSTK